MTEQEAIKYIENHGYISDDVKDIAIKALEKQIPKKPTYDGDGYAPDGTFVWDEWLCPCCRSRYEIDYDEYDFCPNCGQAIDWSEKNEQQETRK